MEPIEIYYALPADFGHFANSVQQYLISRFHKDLDFNVEQLKSQGASDIRWCYETNNPREEVIKIG